MYLLWVLPHRDVKSLGENRQELPDSCPLRLAGLGSTVLCLRGVVRLPGWYPRLVDNQRLVSRSPKSATATPTCPDAPGVRA
jgi:hypothetical protein